MGLDLRIYPMESFPRTFPPMWERAYGLSSNLYFMREYNLFKQIGGRRWFGQTCGDSVIHTESVPADVLIAFADFECRDDESMWKTGDAYGEPLCWCYASEFSKIALRSDTDPYNAAILAFLKALPDKIRVLLYWC